LKGFRVGHDLAMTQREAYKRMVEEAKRKDQEDGSENWVHLVRGHLET